MTQIISLAATARDRAGKGTARAARREGLVPAVIYGNKEKPVMISLDYAKFNRELHRPGFFTHLFEITLDGTTHRVLPRDVQLDPVYDRPLHVDFLRVGETTEITLKVPVEFVNVETCPGLKKGGVLNIVRHDIEVFAKASNLPEKIVVDLAGFEVGSSIHISSVKLPEGVRPTITDRDFTVATIAAPTVKGEA
ncbi:50S ribosomal protein L25/general stress protein Ctc [Niveispirillum lacus]|uniref:Large ribosomal subunit protein bL25 n=1 Tax=Niveispirillum lacus TaxID=1981099 RepID=A0A255YW99_9PROT|nr:50S ribosomal protein L25/general stress protein Ctc [Niveispirillum lacus]OYQ33517.1 50S ribosomal protein L25/general stress protein Ctc [Niveispirillum lacus]